MTNFRTFHSLPTFLFIKERILVTMARTSRGFFEKNRKYLISNNFFYRFPWIDKCLHLEPRLKNHLDEGAMIVTIAEILIDLIVGETLILNQEDKIAPLGGLIPNQVQGSVKN